MNYQDFQNQESSEKLTLAILHAAKRLRAWTLHSGSIYKLENFNVQAVVSIEDSGTAYTEVDSISEVTASKFYNDRDNKVLYLRTTGSDNPDGRFIVITFKLFFANAPITLPHDLDSGDEVYFEPSIKNTSAFGVEIDTVNQISEAIEGSGNLTLHNDTDFWRANFDKLVFENKTCLIYSFNRDLTPDQAKLIFKGNIESKSYSKNEIKFTLKDTLSVLRDPISLPMIQDLGERHTDDLAEARQRMILGRVYGHVLTNLDNELEGYPLAGTVSISIGTNTVTGVGTSFLSKLSPNDSIVLNGEDYAISTVDSDTSLTLANNFDGSLNISNEPLLIKGENPKRYMNRRWSVAGHSTRQPETTVLAGSTVSRLKLGSTKDIQDLDWLWVGNYPTGELVRVNQVVNGTYVDLTASLLTIPPDGTPLFRPSVQNVRIDNVLLVYGQDYEYDAETGILELSVDAEKNSAPAKQLPSNLIFTNGSPTVTGTDLTSYLKPGNLVSVVGREEYFEVLSVDSSTQLTLRTPATFSSSFFKGLYKTFVLDPSNSVVTCDVLGRTDDGTPSGNLLDTAPKVVQALLEDIGLGSIVDTSGFQVADNLAYQPIGLVVPSKAEDTDSPTYRDVFNRINPSVFGCVVQNNSFQLTYVVLQPDKKVTALRLQESDILDFKINSSGDKLTKTSKVFYRPMEYKFDTKKEGKFSQQKTSDLATYVVKTNRENTFETVLCDEVDAMRHSARWATILETATTSLIVRTKLQAIDVEVGSVVDISHRKLYERYGSTGNRKLALVESVKKTGTGVELTLVDLSNSFNRIASITSETSTWQDSDEDARLYGGFYTDQYGLINSDPDSAGLNLIW